MYSMFSAEKSSETAKHSNSAKWVKIVPEMARPGGPICHMATLPQRRQTLIESSQSALNVQICLSQV